ncbi:MAG: hypothetical protein ABWZ56_03670 [Flavobacterium sp.]
MKKITAVLLVILGITSVFGQKSDKPEFIGENFTLEGALAMFKKSKSLEEFEKLLNQKDNNVNNLDLNNDNKIDYITVLDIHKKDTHVIVLSTYLNEKEKQDIATVGIEKIGVAEAILQIEGDKQLYAENTIVEPFDIKEIIDKSKGGPNVPEILPERILVNVWLWPCVRFIYAPDYKVWNSPYRWELYPRGWKPWKPFRHAIFITQSAPHRIYYHKTPTHHVMAARKVYAPKRNSSNLVVQNRLEPKVVLKIKRGNIKAVKISKKGRRYL